MQMESICERGLNFGCYLYFSHFITFAKKKQGWKKRTGGHF